MTGLQPRHDAWRMFHKGLSPEKFLSRLGIEIDCPTVRDAVAFDLVKLDDGSVSNNSEYTFEDHVKYSTLEYERYLLHKNFRVNLVDLEPEWTRVKYKGREDGEDELKKVRTVEKMYQGARLSTTLLGYFKEVFDKAFDGNGKAIRDFNFSSIYVPFTNANDFTTEVSLVPNTHPDFRAVTSRAYYDMKYKQYRKQLARHGIFAISSFALVDQGKDKNHTGQYLVKLQRKVGEDKYQYIVAKIDKDGQILDISPDQKLRIWSSERNEILSVFENDFLPKKSKVSRKEEWTPTESDIPMVKSTTSSHYSVFSQRIPDYDLRYVRNYIQFKTRLEGMELCLLQLKRDIWRKEVQCSECFNKETIAIWRLFQELTGNKERMELVKRYYDLVAEYDQLVARRIRLRQTIDAKRQILDELLGKYNQIDNSNMDEKIALGQKIKSVKLEIDKTYSNQLSFALDRINAIVEEAGGIIEKIENPPKEEVPVNDWSESSRSELERRKQELLSKLPTSRFSQEEMQQLLDSTIQHINNSKIDAIGKIDGEAQEEEQQSDTQQPTKDEEVPDMPVFKDVYSGNLKNLILLTERWKGYMFNLGYELAQMKKMLTVCDDATIKVRRLVHNFKERMEETEAQVWDSNHQIKDDFDLKNIALAGLQDIILLHDWYACNAPEKTFSDMGFNNESQFLEFRRKCNKISYNLRLNQYAKMLAIQKTRYEDELNDIKSRMDENNGTLKYNDKYGWESKKEQDASIEKKWELSKVDATKPGKRSIRLFADVEKEVQGRISERMLYEKDFELLEARTIKYLQDIGVVKDEDDIQNLVLENKAVHSPEATSREISKIERLKSKVDESKEKMLAYRDSLKSILDSIFKVDQERLRLKEESARIFNQCFLVKDNLTRNSMLMRRLDMEKKIEELSQLSMDTRRKHLDDLSRLEKMKEDVDNNQRELDDAIDRFKKEIGVDKSDISNLMVGIYNKFQDEILEHSERKGRA